MKRTQSVFQYFALMWMVVVLTACANMQVDTFNKKLASGYATVQVVAESANSAFTAGKLSKEDAANVVTTTRAAITAMDMAAKVHVTSPEAGDSKLQSALVIIGALQAYLATRGVK